MNEHSGEIYRHVVILKTDIMYSYATFVTPYGVMGLWAYLHERQFPV